MKTIWAPWRMEYIREEKTPGCFFCEALKSDDDRAGLVLHRAPGCVILMNRYPYTNGHLLVAPERHVGLLEELTREETADMMAGTQTAARVLKSVLNAEGLNIGINQGKVAGAGVEEHLHVHVVPRWNGDTNFMPVMADIRVMPEALLACWDQLYPAFQDTI